jgi:hypothetical protein
MTSAFADGSLFHQQKSPTMLLRCGGLHNHKKRQADLSQQISHDAEPFRIERLVAPGLTCAVVPVACVALIAFLAMEVRMNPRTFDAFILLCRLVRSRPITFAVPPKSGEGECESGWRLTCGE